MHNTPTAAASHDPMCGLQSWKWTEAAWLTRWLPWLMLTLIPAFIDVYHADTELKLSESVTEKPANAVMSV